MTIEFYVNQEHISTDASPGLLALDWLRKTQRLTGTKEGCKEGDCGACSVMVGTLQSDRIVYKAMTSCLIPLGDLHGHHLLTIEGVNLPQGQLNPPQAEMVKEGGAQCGFCTPGFIVSMCWYLLQSQDTQPNATGLKHAISGNLCRCTGYGSINRSIDALADQFGENGQYAHLWSAPNRIDAMVDAGLFPAYLKTMPEQLATLRNTLAEREAKLPPEEPTFVIAGGTDLYVQRGEEIPHAPARLLNHRELLDYIEVHDTHVRVGALTSFETFASNPHIQAMFPSIKEDMALIASLPIRERATIAGNIINASPIGDMTALMLAVGSTITLQNGDGQRRSMPLEDLYLGYKTLSKTKDEIVIEFNFDTLDDGESTSFEKVSKRRWLDIATVNSAARIRVDAQNIITAARLTLGGVAATPLYVKAASEFLIGKPINEQTINEMLAIADGEISPISDVRGSARYKRLLARQLLVAHFHKLYPEHFQLNDIFQGADFATQEVRP